MPAILRRHPDDIGRETNLYLFIQKPPIHCETLKTYWSLDPTGSGRLSSSDLVSFGLKQDAVEAYRTLNGCYIDNDFFEYHKAFYEKLGINPGSNEAAHILGLPLVQFHNLPDEYEGE